MTPKKDIPPLTPGPAPLASPDPGSGEGRPRRKKSAGKAGDKPEKPGKRSRLMVILDVFILILNILAAGALIICAFSGYIDPLTCRYAVLPAMVFPLVLVTAAFLFILDLIWWRRTALVAGGAMLICIEAISNFCPLNFPRRALTEEQQKHAFTLMTYNVMAFQVQKGIEGTANPQISYILEQDPDVVCVQEYMLMMKNRHTRVRQAQVDSLYRRYPYVLTNSYLQAIFSKYPVEPIPIDFENIEGKGDMAGWRLKIDDSVINLFSLHLRSLYFTGADKALYKKMFIPDSINRRNLSSVKSGILHKIMDASRARALQLDSLKRYIRKYGGPNTIVCGDFNEPVGCWGLHTLESECKMRQVYSEVGFGPMITYNANRFYVRIDHILYRGRLEPRSITRGTLRASDHYPLTTLFCLKED